MMIFPSSMHPRAIGNMNEGRPHPFVCAFCSTKDTGRHFPARKKDKSDWAVLPEGWREIEDRRPKTKTPFLIVCPSGDCQHRAEQFHNGV